MKPFQGEKGASRLTATVLMLGLAVLGVIVKQEIIIAQSGVNRFAGPTSSQPLALDAAGNLLIVANPDNNTATLFEVRADRNQKVQEVLVGQEPNGAAMLPDGSRAYIANTVTGTVSVLAIARGSRIFVKLLQDIPVGTEPYGLALTPNGRRLYVTNARSNNITVIDTATNRVVRTIQNVGFEPRGIAITNDGDEDDNDETAYVTQFLGLPAPGKIDGEDDSKLGKVTVIDLSNDTLKTVVDLKAMRDTGFKAPGDAIRRIAPPANITEESLTEITGAYPNQLNGIGVKGDFAYIPNTGASPNGPVRFDVNTQALLCAVNRRTNLDGDLTINMHTAVRDQTAGPRLFMTSPWAIAFKHRSDEGYVVSAASDVVGKVVINPQTGQVRVQTTADRSRVVQVATGKNPRGIVINASDTRAYVANYISRDVTVINLANDTVLATVRSAAVPVAGTFEDTIHIGKELYNSSTGTFDPVNPFDPPQRGRLSNNGWGSCASCHPNGGSDNVVWIFGAGPRRTVPQFHDFDPSNVFQQRPLNWSGIFDEVEDFENNIRGASGGRGLLVLADGVTQDPTLAAFTPPSGGRRQVTVRNIPAWDAIKAYVQFGIRAPISPVRKDEPDVIAGEQIFRDANCQSCHGTPLWINARIKFTPAPSADLIRNGQVVGELTKVGTFDPTIRTEVRQNAAAPLGADGFIAPSLMSLFAYPQTFLHNGVADSLEAVMDRVEHRASGTNGVDTLADPERRRQLIRFMLSIDGNSPDINP